VPSRQKPVTPATDDKLLAAITRDMRAIYEDVIRRPLPPALAAALVRLECRTVVEARVCCSKSLPLHRA
jgi:hypothetical protein